MMTIPSPSCLGEAQPIGLIVNSRCNFVKRDANGGPLVFLFPLKKYQFMFNCCIIILVLL